MKRFSDSTSARRIAARSSVSQSCSFHARNPDRSSNMVRRSAGTISSRNNLLKDLQSPQYAIFSFPEPVARSSPCAEDSRISYFAIDQRHRALELRSQQSKDIVIGLAWLQYQPDPDLGWSRGGRSCPTPKTSSIGSRGRNRLSFGPPSCLACRHF